MTKAKPDQDFDDVISEPQDVIKAEISFPADTDASTIEKVTGMIGKLTAEEVDRKEGEDKARAEFKVQASRRWKCIVESLQSGVEFFELYVPDPNNPDKPVKIQAIAGVLLEDGLNQHAIEMLKYEYHTEPVKRAPKPGEDMGLNQRIRKVPHWRVEIFEEIKNPKPIGSKEVGK